LDTTANQQSARNQKDGFFIVGIGASAGGLEALNLFFDNMPSDSGMAFVIVQHLDPTHKSLLSELIARHTKMTVAEVLDGVKIKPNFVYIIPPNKDLRIFHGALEIFDPTEQRAKRRPIDSFLQSLADDQKGLAIGIILSGTGTEGALGLKEILAEGGMTIVQDPKTAQFSGMPDNAIAAKSADYILPPDKMPKQLLQYVRQRSNTNISPKLDITAPLENQLKKIFMIIRDQTGNDFSNYKTNTIIRRISKRTALHQIDSIEQYIVFLQNNPEEVVKLYKDFLIGVTLFFRDKEVFKSVENKVLPYLIEKCQETQELRAWVCGCSTGEEAYSLAMLFKDGFDKSRQYIKVMIFATDIDKDAIEVARIGSYPESIQADISPEYLSRYFIKKERGFQIKKEIRDMVVFAHHNVIKDPPFSKMDFISCRNLLIYMNSDLQKKIIPTFHYSLKNDGILLLGPSESIGEYTDMFAAFDQKIKTYKKINVSTRKNNPQYQPLNIERQSFLVETRQSFGMHKKTFVSGITEKILLDQYAPPSVIIDQHNDALYFSGNTGLYLEPPSGTARLNILDMAKKGLKAHLISAIKKARNLNAEVQKKGIDVMVSDYFNTINLRVKPLYTKEYDAGALMIIFEPVEKLEKNIPRKTTEHSGKRKPSITEIEKELKITREHLQTAINELETSNEDLQSANEEFQSSNEELQSTNEELETSREELQSVNEELITVNNELSNKIDQLSQSNNDLNNLLRSIEVATLYLDPDLKIKRFTAAATKIFNLIPSDIDRPVTQLSSTLHYHTLADDVKHALKTLEIKSMEVNATDGTWYKMRIIPYRTAENIIEGVLITLVDINDQKNVAQSLKKTNEHLNLIMENLPAIPFSCIIKPVLKIDFVGKNCEKITGFLPEQFTSDISFWTNRIHPEDQERLIASFTEVAKTGSQTLPFRWKCDNGIYKNFIHNIRYAAAENGRPDYIVGFWQETNS
jgi:two-component system CheB/CheR fusion protein